MKVLKLDLPRMERALRTVGTQMKMPTLYRTANKIRNQMGSSSSIKMRQTFGDQRRARQRREAAIQPNPVR